MEELMREPSLEELENLFQVGLQKKTAPIRCKLAKWMDSLPQDKKDKVQKLIDLEMSHAQVTLLIQRVFDVKKDIVRQHRTETCRCRN